MDHDQGGDPDHRRDDVEAEHRERAEDRHRDQPDPDPREIAGAAPKQREQTDSDQVNDQHQGDE